MLWRDDDGTFHLQDAYCPHLGAHLGVGGKVDGASSSARSTGGGSTVKERARTSRTASAPTSRRTCARTRRSSATASCSRGTTRTSEAPQWDIPVIDEIGDPGWSDYYRSTYIIRTIPQEMSENGVDPAHFRYVHGTDEVAEMESYDTDGPCSEMLSKQAYVTPRGVTYGRIDVWNHGPGFSQIWFSGIVDALNIATTTPIDDETHADPVQLHGAQVRRRDA